MTDWGRDPLVVQMLVNGLFDWVSAGFTYTIAMDSGATDPTTLRALAIGLAAEVLVDGLMVAGDYTKDGFVPWQCSTAEAIVKMTTGWLSLPDPRHQGPAEVVWLKLTPAGEAIARPIYEADGINPLLDDDCADSQHRDRSRPRRTTASTAAADECT
jgi:hypothetical protein